MVSLPRSRQRPARKRAKSPSSPACRASARSTSVREGFLDQIKTKYPGIQVTVDRFADGQATTGLNMMTDLITANPNIVGVFASNLIMAQGVGQAIAENKLGDKIKVIGFDSDEKTVGFLKEGVLAGLVVQDPYRMGYDGVKTALAVSKGERSRPSSTPAQT